MNNTPASNLNPAQQQAVSTTEGPLLVLAGAGSGKTKVLTERIAHIIEQGYAKPWEILAITFTNKAAGEMKSRLAKTLGEEIASQLWVSTFHAFAMRVLRYEGKSLGYEKNFTVYDDSDSRRLTRKCLADLDMDEKKWPLKLVRSVISKHKNGGPTISGPITDVFTLYQDKLAKANAMDFDDLLLNLDKLLQEHPDVAEKYQNKFKYVNVDEFQDVNGVQSSIVQALAKKHRNIMVVGDDFQCFPNTTIISTRNGFKKIEDIIVDDEVLSAIGDGIAFPTRVTETSHKHYEGKLTRIHTESGKVIVGTPNHLTFSKSHVNLDQREMLLTDKQPFGYIPLEDLEVGMVVATVSDGEIVEDRVENIFEDDFAGEVYDFNVAETHNYIADGLVCHNSIYGFRNADISNILNFEKTYPEAITVKLEQNYRSTGHIVAAAGAVIAHNSNQKKKNLFTNLGDGEKVVGHVAEDEHGEGRFIISEIRRLQREENCGYGDFAVFYRTNAQSRAVEESFARSGVPYKIVGGTKYFDRAEIKTFRCYLQLVVNPADDMAFGRIINTPKRGIGDTTLDKISEYAGKYDINVFEALKLLYKQQKAPLKGKSLTAAGDFIYIIDEMQKIARNGTITEVISKLLTLSGLIATYEEENTDEANGRIENLREFITVGAEYESSNPKSNLAEFIEWLALRTDLDEIEEGEGYVTLMTVHTSKGLEFPVVFVAGLEEQLFPHSSSLESESDLEEERRLCYVAITRARKRLYLLRTKQRFLFGQRKSFRPSRFLAEIPPENLAAAPDFATGIAPVKRSTGNQWEDMMSSGRTQPPRTNPTPPIRPTNHFVPKRPTPPVPSIPQMKREATPGVIFARGDMVLHRKFGEGVVVKVNGDRLTVRFSVGEKELLASYAPMTKLVD